MFASFFHVVSPLMGSDMFPRQGRIVSFRSKVLIWGCEKRFPSKVLKWGSQAIFANIASQPLFPSEVSKFGCEAGFSSEVPKQGSAVRYPREIPNIRFRRKVLKWGSEARFLSEVSRLTPPAFASSYVILHYVSRCKHMSDYVCRMDFCNPQDGRLWGLRITRS